MARRIKDVKDRLRSIMKDGKKMKLVGDVTHSGQPSTSLAQTVNLRGLNIIERESHPVAIESKVEEVLHLLNDPAAPVIAVVGMGGVGKTFLMQNVFDRIKDKFDKSIWLAISQSYSLKKLQAALAMKLDLDEVVNERVDEVKAAELIHGQLESTRFLIVLDDVWRANQQENLVLALGIPRGNNPQSKIVITTRSRYVSGTMNALVYELQPLSEEESWNLFCAFAFQGNQPPHHLEGIARQVERECGRLPLAVKTVAASLAGERLSRDWELKLQQLREAYSTEDPIMQILKLSYDSLPSHLKPCFVYLSFFPEDEEIEYQYLIKLWIAEGYVPHREDQLDVGWSYICHLHNLCLLERVDYLGDDIRYDLYNRWFKIHDLLLDLAISIARESQCAFSVEEDFKKVLTVQTGRRYRRILMGKRSIGNGDVDAMAKNKVYSASCLRTLSFSENGGIQNVPAILLNGARVLRVLDLSYTGISSLPDCVGNLKLLRVLNLSGTKITEVPECVRNNKSLRFLDISYCSSLQQFPEWIGELTCLEHLDIRPFSSNTSQGRMPHGICRLVSLQVLKLDDYNHLSVGESDFLKLEHFANLVNLREVRINIEHEAELKSIEDGILATLVKMRNLTILNQCSGNLPPLSEKMLTMKDLEYLLSEKMLTMKLDDGNHLSVGESDFLKLENLVNLRRVWINIEHEAELKSIEDGILATLVKMRNLTICNKCSANLPLLSEKELEIRSAHMSMFGVPIDKYDYSYEVNLPPLSEEMLAMEDLEYLCLYRFAVPNWICGFSNLMQLQLWSCHCAEYPALEMMPNLIKLELFINDSCKALPEVFGKPGRFPQLRYFEIISFSVLEELPEV